MFFEVSFSTLVGLDLPCEEGTEAWVSVRIGAEARATTEKKKIGSDAIWEEDLRLGVPEAVLFADDDARVEVSVASAEGVIGLAAHSRVSALRAALDATKQLTLELVPRGALAASARVSRVETATTIQQQQQEEETAPPRKKLLAPVRQERKRMHHDEPFAIARRRPTEEAVWPATDAFVVSAVERYIAECERAGVKHHGLRKYKEYLATVPPICMEEREAVRSALDQAAAAYAVALATNASSSDEDDELLAPPLGSPRHYKAVKRALRDVEELLPKEEDLAPIGATSTAPRERRDGSWLDVETRKTQREAPPKIWERKLEMLERLKPAGHVKRRVERTRNVVEPGSARDVALRRERRLDATPAGWEWEEDEREARRRRYAKRTKAQAAEEKRADRRDRPTEEEAVADALVAVVAATGERSERDRRRSTREARRRERRAWHPACGARHMRRLDAIDPNAVRAKYRKLRFTTRGQALRIGVELLEPKRRGEPAPLLSKKARTASLDLDLAVAVPALCARTDAGALDASEREAFESALRADVARAAFAVPVGRVVIDELRTLRRDGGGEGIKKPRRRRRKPRWPRDANHLAVARLSLIHDESASEVAARVAAMAGDPGSVLLARGTVTHACVGARAAPVEDVVPSAWEQYWAHVVSPVFWGRDLGRFAAVVKAKDAANLLLLSSSSSEDEAGPPALAPGACASARLERLRQAAVAAELGVDEKRTYFGFDGAPRLAPHQLRQRRKARRAALAFESEKARHERRAAAASKTPEWWERPKPLAGTFRRRTTFAKPSSSSLCRGLAKKREAAREAKAARRRADATRAKRWLTQAWLVRKLVVLEPAAYYAAINAATRERRAASRTGPVVQASVALGPALRWLYAEIRDATGGDQVRKRDVLSMLADPPLVAWASREPQARAVWPLLMDSALAIAFLAAPFERPGIVAEDELVLFGEVVAEVAPVYRRALHLLDAQIKAAAAAAAAAAREREEEREAPAEAEPCSSAEPAVPAVEERWHASHAHVFVRDEETGRAYCCVCRRRRVAEVAARTAEAEAARDAREAVESRLRAEAPGIEAAVEAERLAARREAVGRREVELVVSDLVDRCSGDAVARCVAAIVEAAARRFTTTTTTILRARNQLAFASRVAAAASDRETVLRRKLEAVRATAEREEAERRAMVAEERRTRQFDEDVARQREETAEREQTRGSQAFHATLASLGDRCPARLARLKWIETLQLEPTRAIHLCCDPARPARVILGLAWRDVDHLRSRAEKLQDVRRAVVKVLSVDDFVVEDFNHLGTCYGKGRLAAVVILAPTAPPPRRDPRPPSFFSEEKDDRVVLDDDDFFCAFF